MNKKLVLSVTCVAFLISILFPATESAEISVGVKAGDWIEYNVVYAGTPPENYPTWFKIEMLSVQGTSITLNVTRELLNGTLDTKSLTLDLQTGAPDLAIIPANLNNGDMFYHEDIGNITISGVEEKTYASAKRIVVYATVLEAELYWDKATGVLLEVIQSTASFIQNLKAEKTNMWQAQILGLDSTVFYALVIVAIGLVVLAVMFLFMSRRKKLPEEIVSPPHPTQT